MEQAGISKLDLKRCNRMQILKLLRQNGPTSRIDISRALNLTRAAVTIITNEMIDNGVLYRKGEVTITTPKPTRGRKKVLIDIAPNYKFVFGVAVDQSVINVGLSNLNGDILGKRSERLPDLSDKNRIINTIIKHVKDIKAESCLEHEQILGLGLCIAEAHFKELDIKLVDKKYDFSAFITPLKNELEFTVIAEELVNSLSLADIDFGNYSQDNKPTNIVFIRYRQDVSSSAVIDNEIYFGSNNKACRFGHMVIDKEEGEECPICGHRGCLNTTISGKSLAEKIDKIYSPENTPKLYAALGSETKAPGRRAIEEFDLFLDEAVYNIVAESTVYLSRGIINTIRMFDPEKIVFFGKMFENKAFTDCIMDNLAKFLDEESLKLITFSSIKTKAVYLAGCSTAVRKLFIQRGGLD